ncbi:MAG TPA: glycosyltransferase family 87 protein, partial [Candidatus Acidoferrum sp.]|nr:glycosyltransferase family 87 protein [Candidatus Acidoferrum sp.]
PPMYLLIVWPLALLPYAWSLLTWTVATFAAYLAVMWKVDRERDSLWLAIAFPGALVNLTNGQNGFLTLALLGGALLTLQRRPILSGVMFGLMSYKPQYGILVPIFLIATGRWRALAAAAATVGLLVALSFATYGAQTWQAFFSSISFTRHVVLENGGSGFEKLQSAFAAARLWGFSIATSYIVQAAVSLLAAVIAIWTWRRAVSPDLHAAALATAILLTTPYMMDYDLVVLALPIAWLALEGRRSGFLPWEKSLLAFVWLLPLFARSLAGHAMIPVAPLAMLLLLGDVARRVAGGAVPVPSQERVSG